MLLVWVVAGCGEAQVETVLWGADPVAATNAGAVRLAPGAFRMGSPESEEGRFPSETLHQVTLTRAMLVGAHEVTQEQYQRVMGTTPSHNAACPTCPVEKVSWYEAVTFCNRVSERESLELVYWQEGQRVLWNPQASGYRLLTEAEWEYAARAGDETRFSGGETIADVGWASTTARGKTHPVGQLQPNAWGLYDMTGNVREWVWDFPGSHSADAVTDPSGAPQGTERANRGGSWSSDERRVRVAYRRWGNPNDRNNSLGFRVARTVP